MEETLDDVFNAIERENNILQICFPMIDDVKLIPGEVMELFGPSQSGKSEFLYHIVPWMALNQNMVVYIDLDGRFSIQTILDILEVRRTPQKVISRMLYNIMLIQPHSSLELLNAIWKINSMDSIYAVVVDGFSAFSWMIRAKKQPVEHAHAFHRSVLRKLIQQSLNFNSFLVLSHTFPLSLNEMLKLRVDTKTMRFEEKEIPTITYGKIELTLQSAVQRGTRSRAFDSFQGAFEGQTVSVFEPELNLLPDAVLLFVFSSDLSKLLFVKHRERGWELPGGKVNSCESDAELTAQREVYEEAGITLQIDCFKRVFDYRIDLPVHHKAILTTKYDGLLPDPSELVSETMDCRWISVHQLKEVGIKSIEDASVLLKDKVFPLGLQMSLNVLDLE